MDYKNHYRKLIETRINRTLDDTVYYERHHIIPKCVGGSNSTENTVHLTAREHYVAHWLLFRIRPHSNGLALSFWRMSHIQPPKTERYYSISSRAYSEAKQAMADANRRRVTGRKIEEKHLIKWRRNKNNSRMVINMVTNETYPTGKAAWRAHYKDVMSYSNFNSYLRGKVKGIKFEYDGYEGILNWKYSNDANRTEYPDADPIAVGSNRFSAKRRMLNVVTGEEMNSAREVYRMFFEDRMVFESYIGYVHGTLAHMKEKKRNEFDDNIYHWTYKENINAM